MPHYPISPGVGAAAKREQHQNECWEFGPHLFAPALALPRGSLASSSSFLHPREYCWSSDTLSITGRSIAHAHKHEAGERLCVHTDHKSCSTDKLISFAHKHPS